VESQSQGTLIMATPSKPRNGNAMFGYRTLSNTYNYPTPIREDANESGGKARATFIAETPVGPGRMSAMPFSLQKNMVAEMPGQDDDTEGDEDEDELGEFAVMTDEEDGDIGYSVPETPMK
jgi:hypothetical protein